MIQVMEQGASMQEGFWQMHEMEEATTAFPLLSKRQLCSPWSVWALEPKQSIEWLCAGRAEAGAEDAVDTTMVMARGTWWGLLTPPPLPSCLVYIFFPIKEKYLLFVIGWIFVSRENLSNEHRFSVIFLLCQSGAWIRTIYLDTVTSEVMACCW